MVAVSKYEDAAKAFLKEHPVGTTVTADRIVTWASAHANGLASDLLIDDAAKRLNALRRHLNDGAASRNLREQDRFHLVVEDAKRKTVVVRSLAEHVSQQADLAFDKSVVGAMQPLKRSQRAIDDIKLEELPPEQQQELERQLQELVETAVPLRTVLSEQVIGRWVGKLESKGYSADQARHMIEIMPTMSRLHKLLKYTS